jgi:diketogulonate reductase-like aldo/keto reductase
VGYCQENGIAIQAYCPIVRNRKGNDPILNKIAQKHNVTPNQVLLRYSLQKDWIPLPKSDNPDRMRTNASLYQFELSDDDMSTLDGLDQGAAGAIVQAVTNE